MTAHSKDDGLVAEMRAYHADMLADDGGECRATAMYREAADTIERLLSSSAAAGNQEARAHLH